MTGSCQFGRVPGPVASGLAHPAGRGARGDVQQVGEDGGGHLGGEVGERGAAACHGVDARMFRRWPSREAVIGWPGRPPGNSHGEVTGDPVPMWARPVRISPVNRGATPEAVVVAAPGQPDRTAGGSPAGTDGTGRNAAAAAIRANLTAPFQRALRAQAAQIAQLTQVQETVRETLRAHSALAETWARIGRSQP
jgi:hypothetical protein